VGFDEGSLRLGAFGEEYSFEVRDVRRFSYEEGCHDIGMYEKTVEDLSAAILHSGSESILDRE
jgi:hypothetical protein